MISQGIFLKYCARSVTGKKRSKNEDAFVVVDLDGSEATEAIGPAVSLQVTGRGVLIAVSDGMGGAHAGEVASSLVVGALHQGLSTVQAADADAALRETIGDANQQVFDTAQATGRDGMGATLTAVLFHEANAYIAEVGDSRAYLVRSGRIVQLTRDQTYVQQLLDAGAITPEEAETHEFKNMILQAMGVQPSVVVVTSRIDVRGGDRFLVCSDGLSGKLQDQAMLSVIHGAATQESACEALIATAIENGSEDDITVVLAEVSGEGVRAMTPSERSSFEMATTLKAG